MSLRAGVLSRRLGLRRFVRLVLHLPDFAKLFLRLLKDPHVPLGPKLLFVGLLAYVIFPADLLPDFLLGIGQLDDLVVVFLGLKLFLRLCPRSLVQQHVQAIAAGR